VSYRNVLLSLEPAHVRTPGYVAGWEERGVRLFRGGSGHGIGPYRGTIEQPKGQLDSLCFAETFSPHNCV